MATELYHKKVKNKISNQTIKIREELFGHKSFEEACQTDIRDVSLLLRVVRKEYYTGEYNLCLPDAHD